MRACVCLQNKTEPIVLNMIWWLKLVTVLVIQLLTQRDVNVAGNPDAKRLYDDLLSNYNRLIRPVSNNTQTVLVKLGLRLSQLIDLVSVAQDTVVVVVALRIKLTLKINHAFCFSFFPSFETEFKGSNFNNKRLA